MRPLVSRSKKDDVTEMWRERVEILVDDVREGWRGQILEDLWFGILREKFWQV